jgi:protocatechuate 3,4-dioxygenase beta subunit
MIRVAEFRWCSDAVSVIKRIEWYVAGLAVTGMLLAASDATAEGLPVFQIRDCRIGLLQRAAMPPGAREATFQVRLAADIKATKTAEVPNTPLKVTGRVLDTFGRPIAGAEVFLAEYMVEHKLLAQTTTDLQGHYEFRDVPLPFHRAEINRGNDVGAFQVFALAESYSFAWRPMKRYYPGLTRAQIDALNFVNNDSESPDRFCPEHEIELDLHCQKAVSLPGHVINERGEPLAGVRLSIRQCDSGVHRPDYNISNGSDSFEVLNQPDIVPSEIKTRVTDEQGRFTFTNLPPNCRFWTDVRAPSGSRRSIWLATKPGLKADQKGRPIFSENIEIRFRTPHKIPFDVVFADTGLPAPKVLVNCALDDVSAGGATNEAGQIDLNLPGGKGRFELLPRIGTPYLVTNGPVEIPDAPASDFRVRLAVDRAAILELTVIDADTGMGLENVQLGRAVVDRIPDDLGGAKLVTREEEHFFRSYEQETRIARVERPKTDKDGRLTALFLAGSHRLGLVVASWPKGYRPVEPGPTTIACKAGETVRLTLKMQKMQ